MTFTIDLTPVKKSLEQMESGIRKRLLYAASSLANNPRPPGAIKLEGVPGMWRIRVSDYRIIYRVEDDRLVILVVKIGHRREIYR